MKRLQAILTIGLISSLLLTGCQKATEPLPEDNKTTEATAMENQAEDSQKEESPAEEQSENSASKEAEAEDIEIDENPVEEEQNMAGAAESEAIEFSSEDTYEKNADSKNGLISGFRILHSDNNYYGEDYHGLIIRHNYEQLDLSDDTKKAYPELEKAVMMVNDLIATDEANCYYADYRQVMKNGEDKSYDHPLSDMEWDIFVRRADTDVVSILVKITTASYEDYNHIRYLSYNINPDTGEVINLWDIIEDQDSLYSVLAQKFLGIMKADYEGLFAGGGGMSEAEVVKSVEESIYQEQLVWTLEPQGVSFWLNSMNLSVMSMNCKILFGEDDKGMIFTSDVRENVPDTWITQLYPNADEIMDADDDGEQDSIYVMELLSFYENSDTEYTSGILIDYNGFEFEFPFEDDVYDFEFSLIHQNGKSILLTQYKEYEYDIQELYQLDEKSVEVTDMICGWISGNPDETFTDFANYSYVTPIITNPSCFNMAVGSYLLSTVDTVFEYRITEEGKFKSLADRGMISEPDRFEITTKMPMDSVPVVDAGTGEATGETEDLKTGTSLKLMYTDIQNYVDCLTEDNKLVRINVYMDDDLGRCVKVNGKNVSVQEMFDNMFYAG